MWHLLGARCQSEDDGEPVLTEEAAEAVNGIAAAAPPAEAFEAVKHVPLAAVDMKRLIAEHFEPFRVGRAAESSGGTAASTQFVWALLPPRHQLLIRFAMTTTATVATFRCDSWRPLAYVDALMESLVVEAGGGAADESTAGTGGA